ncbi:hypothetical protein ACFLYY_01515 [Patescibacteria group bacterium]
MNLGILIILITILAYISNWINWRYLNYKLTHLLYFIGAFIHETSHALACLLTRARVEEYHVFSKQPRVVYSNPSLPIIGQPLISLAPLIGGLLFLFLVNNHWLTSYFNLPQVSNWQEILLIPLKLLSQINLLDWQSWVMVLLFLNVGAMIGPSIKDLKNIWPAFPIFFFIESATFLNFTFLVIGLILTNIIIQFLIIFFISLIKVVKHSFNSI